MNVLFLHQAFPAQFGRLALELKRRYGWTCRFLVDHLSRCPSPSKELLESVEIHPIPGHDQRAGSAPVPWPQVYGRWLELCVAVREAWRQLSGPAPDLVVAHGGQGAPTLFLHDIFDGPIINYCEYYFPRRFADLTYRLDLPPAEVAPFYPRCINAPTLSTLVECRAGYSPTQFQKNSFPAKFKDRIEVHFDGIDLSLYRPGRNPSRRIGEHIIPQSTRIVTFVARGLESMRGFDLFARMAARVSRERADVLFVVAGDDTTYYGWDNHHVGTRRFRDWAMESSGADLSRFLFLGHVEPEVLADLLSISDLHIYASVPFVVSWSFFNALSSACVTLSAETEAVREIIRPGLNGLTWPLFDIDGMADQALAVLDRPADFAPLGQEARKLMEESYGLDVCVPRLKDYFERVVTGWRGMR